jgi:hypothetical protein
MRTLRSLATLVPFTLAFFTACATPTSNDAAQGTAAFSQADHCHVILRELHQSTDGGTPFEVHDVNGMKYLVWRGTIDVYADDLARGGVLKVHFKGEDGEWEDIPVVHAVAGGAPGYARYAFALDHDTFANGDDGDHWQELDLELIPFLELPDGTRIWDHNRNGGDFDNYHLNLATRYRVNEDDSTCATSASVGQ